MKKLVHNVKTNDIILEPLSETQIAELLNNRQKAEKADKEAIAAAASEAKIKAETLQPLLDKLGITADEAKLLLGGN